MAGIPKSEVGKLIINHLILSIKPLISFANKFICTMGTECVLESSASIKFLVSTLSTPVSDPRSVPNSE